MTRHVSVNFPNLPPGFPVSIPGLGDLENGKEYDVTDEEVAAAQANGFTLPPDGKLGFKAPPEGPTKGTDDPFWDRKPDSTPAPVNPQPQVTTGGEAK